MKAIKLRPSSLKPVPANNGLLLQRPEWVKQVIKLARQNGALVIFDEVITGFRVGFGGYAEEIRKRISQIKLFYLNLTTYGKIIGGGFPIGAYGGRSDLMDLVDRWALFTRREL